jgi:beta-glucanase (GH16 family)
MIQSSHRFTFDPSAATTVVEARIRVPGPNAQAGGYWPAFWLLSNQDAAGGAGTWPPEIDIFEFFSNSNVPEAHLHTTGGDINYGEADSDGATDLSLAFHVYTLELSTHALTFYLDGTQRWTYTNAANIARVLSPAPLYVLLNMQFGGAAGNPTGAVPADMVIDYVRAWTAP